MLASIGSLDVATGQRFLGAHTFTCERDIAAGCGIAPTDAAMHLCTNYLEQN
jgi:hypothetical protein